jgi:hypothetical protein
MPWPLCLLTETEENHQAIADADLVPLLVELLQKNSDPLRVAVASTLNTLSGNDHHRAVVEKFVGPITAAFESAQTQELKIELQSILVEINGQVSMPVPEVEAEELGASCSLG